VEGYIDKKEFATTRSAAGAILIIPSLSQEMAVTDRRHSGATVEAVCDRCALRGFGRMRIAGSALRNLGFAIAAAFLLTACAENSPKETPGTVSTKSSVKTNALDRQEFAARGVVKELHPEKGEVVIKHEAITNYMPAMTMPFDVKNTNELAGLGTNDTVSFTMVVTKDNGWIENLKKTGSEAAKANSAGTNDPSSQQRPLMRVVRDVEPLNVGDKMTDYTFTNSFGKKVTLSDFKGQAYAITFIFTRCPFPNFCPRMSSNFSQVYEDLMQRKDAPTNWHLFSLTFDPQFDTPERLREYSERYKPDPKKWDWLTGAMIDIDAITEQFGLVFEYDKGTFNHTLRTVVVDKNGIVRKKIIGNDWQPAELEQEIIAGAKGEAVPKEG
jgi:protein SCO1/2